MTADNAPFNYRYFIDHAARIGGRALDYGCGQGHMIALGLARGIDIWGADTYAGFYADWHRDILPEQRDRIRQIENGRVDYPDRQFDLVMSNQVLEHVTDPEAVIAEIFRVLKPGGVFIAAFPSVETWQEGHVGLYFAHRLPAGGLRRAYFDICHRLGRGLYRQEKTRAEWVRMCGSTLDDVCFYYPRRRLFAAIEARFGAPIEDMSADYMRTRLGARALHVPAVADPLMKWVYHKRAGEILTVRRPA